MIVVFIMVFYMDRHKNLWSLSKRVDGTVYTGRSEVEDMSVNHIGQLVPVAVMARAQGFPELIEIFLFVRCWGICRKDITRLPYRGSPMGEYDFQRRSCSGHSTALKTFETYGRNLKNL